MPAIMSLSKMPPPQAPAHYLPQPQQQPPYLPQQPHPQQFPARPAFSPATVPGMKTLADIEAEMMYGGPPPGAGPGPGAMMMERGGHVGHINPAVHNLNYPGMRDRQTQQHQRAHQRQHQQQHQQQHQAQQMQQQQFRNSPGLSNQQQLQQGLQQQLKHKDHNSQQKIHPPQHHQQHRMNNNHYGDGGNRRRNDNQYDNRRDQFYDRDQRDREQDNYQRQRRYNDPNRRNEEPFGAAAVREAEFKEYGDQSVTRRDLMPGHVHTLGILRHSRSRHDRHNHETFGEELEEQMAANPTGDPLLDARMVEEEEEMARRRKHYANSEDEYAGLMSQKDKQWIINIQLNQLKCDNPYVDDYTSLCS